MVVLRSIKYGFKSLTIIANIARKWFINNVVIMQKYHIKMKSSLTKMLITVNFGRDIFQNISKKYNISKYYIFQHKIAQYVAYQFAKTFNLKSKAYMKTLQ